MQRLVSYIRNVLASFWLLPSLIGLAFGLLGFVLLRVDRGGGIGIGFGGGAPAARSVLTVVAGSLITVTGLTFSLTIVTLQLVSGQFTPRALRGLLSDRVTQVLAGTFVGIVAYSLIVLRSVRDATSDTAGFVPSLSTLAAIIFALAALGLLLYFVHHIGSMIQVSSILARLHEQTLAATARLYPEPFGRRTEEIPGPTLARWRASGEATVVRPRRAGYVRTIAIGDLVSGLEGSGARILVSSQPGDLVTLTTPAIEIWGAADDERARELAAAALVIDNERDIGQDMDFGLQQLSDIALRALSPGVNDPTTADTAIGYLGSLLEHLAAREFPAPVREYETEDVTVITRRRTFAELLSLHVAEVGRYATSDARIGKALLEMLRGVGEAARSANADDRVDAVIAISRQDRRPDDRGCPHRRRPERAPTRARQGREARRTATCELVELGWIGIRRRLCRTVWRREPSHGPPRRPGRAAAPM